MITVTLEFQDDYSAWGLSATSGSGWAAALINDVIVLPWWRVFRKWHSRRYRRRTAGLFAATLAIPFAEVDRAIAKALAGKAMEAA